MVAARFSNVKRLRGATRSTGLMISLGLVVGMEIFSVILGFSPVQVLVSGLALGALYAVVALGYTMVYGIIELINFAHGDVFALGAFVSLTVMEHLDPDMVNNGNFLSNEHTLDILGAQVHVPAVVLVVWTVVLTMVIAALVCGIVGVVIERVAYRPLRNSPKLAPLITAIGVSFIIENAIAQWRGGVSLSYPSIQEPIDITNIGPISLTTPISNIDVFVIVAALVLMVLLDRFINRTKMGKAMRSVAQDREAALMMGINVDRIIALTFFVGSALAGAGAVIYGMQQNTIGSTMGFSLGLFAFTAAVLGGIGNIRGAMLGGLLIGIVKRFVDNLGKGAGTEWADAVVFAILIIVLVFRPSGLLGTQVPEKV